jgi:hypothetical protein
MFVSNDKKISFRQRASGDAATWITEPRGARVREREANASMLFGVSTLAKTLEAASMG